MNIDPSQTLEIIIKKSEENPKLANDLTTYLKVLAVKYCPEEKTEEMKLIFKNGNLNVFYDFLNQFIPNLPEKILDYARNY
jgi:hypothetical protein